MRFALCRAIALSQRRRLSALVAAAPLVAVVVAIAVVLAPLALARLGGLVAGEVAGAAATADVAAALVLGPALAAAAAGAALAAAVPSRAGLGPQIAAGPYGDLTAVAAPLIFPALLSTLALLPSLVSFCLALAGPLPGGRPAGAALALATIAAFPAGAVVAEGCVALTRGRWLLPLVIGTGVVAWAGTGALLGAAPLGALAPVGGALRGSASAWAALAAGLGVAAGLALVWVVLAARRPERVPSARRRRHRAPAWRRPVPAAVTAIVRRRDDVRLASRAALGFGTAGAVTAVVAGAGEPGPFLLATTTTLLGSVVGALAACGALSSGAWLWWGAPHRRHSVVAAAWGTGLLGAAAPVVIVGSIAAVGSGASLSAAGGVAVLVVSGTAVATIAGALVPWDGSGIGDQASSFAALAAVAIVASLLVGVGAPRLATLGLPDPAIAVLVCGVLAGAAVWTVHHRLAGVVR